jgi:hypothetical protein
MNPPTEDLLAKDPNWLVVLGFTSSSCSTSYIIVIKFSKVKVVTSLSETASAV